MPEQDIASLISEHRILLEEAVREVIRRYPQSLSPSENFSKHIFSSEQLKNIIDTVLAEAWQQSAMVVITLCDEKGECVQIEVPGSFFEFIQREIDPETGELDLQFDASNATGIFKMTEGDHKNIDPIDEFDQLE